MVSFIFNSRSPLKFFLLVFAQSIPFWIIGFIVGDSFKIPLLNLPLSALTTFCPLIAAAILVYKEQGRQGVMELLKRSFDFERIKGKKWYLPIVVLMPVMTLISYAYMKMTGAILPEFKIPFLYVLVFFLMYFIGAIGEEVGWSGYATDPLQNRYGALKASIILGFVWAIWHIIPWSQNGQTPGWVMWQSISTILLRIVMVWIFNNTRKSVFAMVIFHVMINLSPYLIPDIGSHYDPFIHSILLMLTVIFVVYLWGTKTLARYRFTQWAS